MADYRRENVFGKRIFACFLIFSAYFCGCRCQYNKSDYEFSALATPDPCELCQGNYLTPAEAKAQLADFSSEYSNRQEWEKRAARIRKGILSGADLLYPPAKCPLKPVIRDRRVYSSYTVENVAFESLPGFYVTGNLYRPTAERDSYAAVLCPHGHFPEPNGGGRFRPDQQIRCATLARMGAIVFSWDMVGWGESTQCKHTDAGVLALQLWNSIRAVDFVSSLEGVDPKKIGITAASGGATQAILLGAVDPRVDVSVPVVMVSAHFFGGCDCESGLPIHKGPYHQTNNAEIAALFAPRPQLIISEGTDWTRYTPEVEFPYIRGVYKLYGASSAVANVHLPNEEHNYGRAKRIPAYKFLAKHLRLSLDDVTSNGSIDESLCTIEERQQMLVFNRRNPRPADGLKSCAQAVAMLD